MVRHSTDADLSERASVKFLDITFMVANAVGIVLYLVLASRGWRIPQEHGMVPVTGGSGQMVGQPEVIQIHKHSWAANFRIARQPGAIEQLIFQTRTSSSVGGTISNLTLPLLRPQFRQLIARTVVLGVQFERFAVVLDR